MAVEAKSTRLRLFRYIPLPRRHSCSGRTQHNNKLRPPSVAQRKKSKGRGRVGASGHAACRPPMRRLYETVSHLGNRFNVRGARVPYPPPAVGLCQGRMEPPGGGLNFKKVQSVSLYVFSSVLIRHSRLFACRFAGWRAKDNHGRPQCDIYIYGWSWCPAGHIQ
ncbi:hypothetical protein IF1G_00310 [Cordyceps javanica]|uniref:Uncharacterized protein n=1 Tax=Cordyceps javanica TaxID=43265 RepID=A0A545VF76_9HYPO|nr:hypothetical protein IF1G_00310 [Cordyceps javanica]